MYILKTAKCKVTQNILKSTKKERKKKEKEKRSTNYKERESLDVSSQALDQSKRKPKKRANSWSSDLSKSSKVR